jgi:hypothetical protein
VQFGVRKVIVGDSRTFAGVADFMRNYGVEVNDLDLQECAEMMTQFIAEDPQLWDEDSVVRQSTQYGGDSGSHNDDLRIGLSLHS